VRPLSFSAIHAPPKVPTKPPTTVTAPYRMIRSVVIYYLL
jgi:hypothetical protein